MAVTLLAAMALPFLLPPNYSLGPRWIIPVVEALLLVALVIADPGRIDRRSDFIRALSIGLVVILVAGAAVVTVRLVVDLIRGGPETNSPTQLLRVGALSWVYVIVTFTFLYWELDGGGPEARGPYGTKVSGSGISGAPQSSDRSTRMAPRVLRLFLSCLHECGRV